MFSIQMTDAYKNQELIWAIKWQILNSINKKKYQQRSTHTIIQWSIQLRQHVSLEFLCLCRHSCDGPQISRQFVQWNWSAWTKGTSRALHLILGRLWRLLSHDIKSLTGLSVKHSEEPNHRVTYRPITVFWNGFCIVLWASKVISVLE